MINIDELIKQAMKSKNSDELRAYKNLKAEIQLLKTAKNAKPYDEAAEIQLISKMCKRLEEDIRDFSEARREDLESECRSELEVLKSCSQSLQGPQKSCQDYGNGLGRIIFQSHLMRIRIIFHNQKFQRKRWEMLLSI